MKSIIVIVFLQTLCLISLSSADDMPAEYGPCTEDVYNNLECTIDSVTIGGGRKDRNSKASKLKRNVNASINVEFTPDFDGNDITMMAYALMPLVEKPFPDMDPNACNHTTCPVVKGVKQTYSFGLKLSTTYPIGLFNVRFLMKQGDQAKCCFITKFRIEK